MVQHISSGSPFERDMAYSRAVVDGDWIFVSGTTGFDYETMTISDDVAVQADQCFLNIAKALQQAGAQRVVAQGRGVVHLQALRAAATGQVDGGVEGVAAVGLAHVAEGLALQFEHAFTERHHAQTPAELTTHGFPYLVLEQRFDIL
jgi:hypothetical protein